MQAAQARLIAKLHDKRQQLGLSNLKFAQYLGIAHGTWRFIRLGHKYPGLIFLAATIKAFPDLDNEIISYLRDYDATVAKQPSTEVS